MDYTIHGLLQARILEWVAFPFSRASSQPTDWSQVSHIAGVCFTNWGIREALFELWGNTIQPITGLNFSRIILVYDFEDFKDINKSFLITENIKLNEIQMTNRMTDYGIWNWVQVAELCSNVDIPSTLPILDIFNKASFLDILPS